MLLLYLVCNAFLRRQAAHLHSTMLLLYPKWDKLEKRNGQIYIPLCFYFIYSTPVLYRLCICYLHSTMLLLYPQISEDEVNELSHIYIPLCFYFIRIEPYKHGREAAFTFHYASTLSQGLMRIRRNLSSFTFHYASTLSREVHMELTRRDGFTFHYASTLSDFKRLLRIIATYLHSTMLLLYRI